MKKKHLRFGCDKCERKFDTGRGLSLHTSKAHPYVPSPAPKRSTIEAKDEYENRTLLGGRNLDIGDVVWLGRKAVITKIIKTEGSPDAQVTVLITKSWYSRREISEQLQ